MTRTSATHPLLLLGLATLAGCGVTELYVGYYRAPSGTTGSGGGGGSMTTTATTTGTGGSGGGPLCVPGAAMPCYDGPAGTAGVGLCKAGAATCAPDGASWGPCAGEVLPQPEDCATPFDEDCDGMAPACKGALQWARRYGDASNQFGTGIAVDAAGKLVVTGYFVGAVNLGGGALTSVGSTDAFVAKLDTDGSHLWSRRFGGPGAVTQTQGVAVDGSGNVLVLGVFGGAVDFGAGLVTSNGGEDIFVAKLDAAGALLWARHFGGAVGFDQAGQGIAVDPAGSVVLTGYFSSPLSFGGPTLPNAGGEDVFVAKLDPSGAHVWSNAFGDGADQSGRGVAVDGAGNVLLVGGFAGSVAFGVPALTSAGGQDVFVAKLDPGGTPVWSRRFGDAQDQAAQAVAADGAGNVLLAGDFSGTLAFGGPALISAGGQDVFVAKLDAGGAPVWGKRFGDALDQSVQCLAVDGGGNLLLTGGFQGALGFGGPALISAGGQDFFAAKLDPSGAHVWSRRAGDAQEQSGRGIAADASGNAFVIGDFSGAADFGGGELASAGGADIFIAAFAP
jgi:hypothetical protein